MFFISSCTIHYDKLARFHVKSDIHHCQNDNVKFAIISPGHDEKYKRYINKIYKTKNSYEAVFEHGWGLDAFTWQENPPQIITIQLICNNVVVKSKKFDINKQTRLNDEHQTVIIEL